MKPNEIRTTRDLGVFKMPTWQRKARHEHMVRLSRSILEHGFYREKPLVVVDHPGDDTHPAGLYVVDGQQRLGAARIAQEADSRVEVAFMISSVPLSDADRFLSLGRNQMNWSTSDCMHFFARNGSPSYQWAERMCALYSSFATSGLICNIASKPRGLGQQFVEVGCNSTDAWKDGKFNPTQEFRAGVQSLFDHVEQLLDEGMEIRSKRSIAALWVCVTTEGYNPQRMIAAHQKQQRRFKPQASLPETVELLAEIYNHKLRRGLIKPVVRNS